MFLRFSWIFVGSRLQGYKSSFSSTDSFYQKLYANLRNLLSTYGDFISAIVKGSDFSPKWRKHWLIQTYADVLLR